MDGETARRHLVRLAYINREIVINGEGGDCLAVWPVDEISPQDRLVAGYPYVLKCEGKANARLHLEQEDTKIWMTNMLPGLGRRSAYGRETRLAWKLAVFLVVLGAVLYFLLPVMAQYAAGFIPRSWEREMFAGAGRETAKQLGASKECTATAGKRVLKETLIRLVGAQEADKITLVVADHKMVNAFATPGDQVVIMRGLLDQADSGDEVVGVLAHELGHVVKRHALEGAVRSAGLTFALSLISGGDWADVAGLLAETSYSRTHEREADDFALEALARANISTDGLADFFEKLDKKQHNAEWVMQFISTHPMSKERADKMHAQHGGGPALTRSHWHDLKQVCSQQRPL
jgi:Zn-dependent protease with chaperone function